MDIQWLLGSKQCLISISKSLSPLVEESFGPLWGFSFMATLLMLVIFVGLLFFCCSLLTSVFIKRDHFESLEGRHIVITGGSTGIGFSLAKQCLLEGAYITIMARTEKNLYKARDSLIEAVGCPSNRILIKAVDVSCAAAIKSAINESFDWKAIDILVCNAGIATGGYFDELAIEQLEAQYRVNFLGSVYPVHAVLPLMKQRSHRNPTSIVFINSLCSLFLACGANAYMCSKFAQKGLAELLKLQLEPYNIKVQLVIPGFTETAMLDEVDKFSTTSPIWAKLFLFKREKARPADEVARFTTAAMKRGNFLSTTGWDGFFLRVLGRGLQPEETIFGGMLELALLLPMRMLTLLWVSLVSNLVKARGSGRSHCADSKISNAKSCTKVWLQDSSLLTSNGNWSGKSCGQLNGPTAFF